MTDNTLHVGTDRFGRTWRVLDRDDSFSVYYTKPGSTAHHVIYDSMDEHRDPPRVLLGRAQEAERERDAALARVVALEEACKKALAFHDRYCDRVGPSESWARAVHDALRAALDNGQARPEDLA